ncbi:hypothetical protein AB4090_12275 [Acidithiobacillus sp. IBUN Pt1247-S3]|uniref:hypothetical protein n=1 Tax=Acidithiobacillus sp. IBUN Pt1247-S3 TaxID=3166642 RepID=UPI0034E3E6E8
MAEDAVQSGFAIGNRGPESLLNEAVEMALGRMARPISGALIAFSPSHLPLPHAALQQLAGRLRCLQIRAASFPGVISDQGSTVGQAACAVLLFSPPLGLAGRGANTLLWAGPQQLVDGELSAEARADCGLISNKHAWFWQYREQQAMLRSTFLGPLRHRQFVSSGISPLTPLFPYVRQEGALLLQLERYSALPLLARNIPFALREAPRLPLDRLLLGERDKDSHTRYLHIVATDANRSGLWLERPLRANTQAFIAWRNPETALRDTRTVLERARNEWGTPCFAWISCSGARAPEFFPQAENDLTLWREHFPHCPILGSFAQAEVSVGATGSELTRFSAVFDLFYREDGE